MKKYLMFNNNSICWYWGKFLEEGKDKVVKLTKVEYFPNGYSGARDISGQCPNIDKVFKIHSINNEDGIVFISAGEVYGIPMKKGTQFFGLVDGFTVYDTKDYNLKMVFKFV